MNVCRNCFLFFFSFVLLLQCGFVFADTSAITTFTVSPSTINSGQLVGTTFSGDGTSGYNLLVTCAPGIKIKKQDGSAFPCDSKILVSSQASDSQGFCVINTSGTQKTVVFKLYPKDIAGTEFESGMRSQSLTVSTAPYPLSQVTATTTAGQTTIAWESPDLDGVNIIFACVDGITIFPGAGGVPISCGRIVSDTKLAGSGALSFSFKNRNSENTSVTATVLPYIADSSYDLIHSQTVSFDVPTEVVLPSSVQSFVASRPRIASDDTIDLIWNTKNTPGVNIKMSCVDSISLIVASSTNPTPCNTFLSDSSLNANSSIKVTLYNSSLQPKNVLFTLYPQFVAGGFDGIHVRTFTVQVDPKGAVVLADSRVVSTATSTSQNVTSTPVKTGTQSKITRSLALGSRNTDVTTLQQILARDSSIYPEGSVTGYFGPATARAVQRFQVKYGITQKGGPGYGLVGPATRAKLNSM